MLIRAAARAGLIPLLRRGALPGGTTPLVVNLLPGAHPFEELEAGLLRVAVNPPDSLMEQLRADERGLTRAVKRVLPEEETSELVLVIDQFEELFTLVADEGVRADFIDSLFVAVGDPRGRLRVVVTLRADYYDRPLLYLPATELLNQRSELVGPLSVDEMYQAISAPAQRVGLELESGLAATILQDVAEQPGTLPLLQYTLTELYERRTGRVLTLAAHRASGGVFGSLAGRAESLYAGLTAPEQVVQTFSGHTGGVRAVAAAPDGQTILTGSLDQSAKLWDVATGRELRTFAGHTDQVNRVAFSPDGQSLLTAGREGIALLWSIALPLLATPLSGHTGAVGTVAFSPDGQAVLTGSADTTARLWDARTHAAVRQFAGHPGSVGATFSPDGHFLLTSSDQLNSDDPLARLWDTQTGAAVRTFTVATGGLYGASFTADGKEVRTRDAGSNVVRRWDVQTGQELDHFAGPVGADQVYGFSPDGTQALTDSGRSDPTLRIWDLRAAQEVRRLVGQTNLIQSAAFSPDGKQVLGGSADNTARLWDAQTSRQVQQFVGHTDWVASVAFSSDGKQVLTGSADTTARLWDAQTGQEVRRFAGHNGAVNGVAFAPDGRQIATASKDGTARLWDLEYQETLRALCGRLVRDLTDDERAQYTITDQGPTCPPP